MAATAKRSTRRKGLAEKEAGLLERYKRAKKAKG